MGVRRNLDGNDMHGTSDIPPMAKWGNDDKGADGPPRPVAAPAEAGPDERLRALNSRRLDLIDKDRRGGLSRPEKEELVALETEVDQLLQDRFPSERRMLEAMEALERKLDAEGAAP